LYNVVVLCILTVFIVSCTNDRKQFNYADTSKVEFRKSNNQWLLYKDNKPYYIKGAQGHEHLELLKQIGGNSILVYEPDISDSLLNVADSLGLTVSVSLDIGKARFKENNYNDNTFKKAQRERVKAIVEKYHKHPAILFWIIGNEIHINMRNNIAVWKELNELSKLIHSIDAYHPTTTTVAAYPTESMEPLQIKLFAPDLDFISLTVYDFAHRVKRETNSFIWGIDKPFLVTEWGGEPYWTCPTTEWDAIIQVSSTLNAQKFLHNNYLVFETNKEKCIGGYVFFWGEKLERTHTLFSLILEKKYKTQAIENLQYLWTKAYPQNFCPRIDTFYIDGYGSANHYLTPDTIYKATFKAHDPENDSLMFKWEIRGESKIAGKTGGDSEWGNEIITKSDTLSLFKEKFVFKTPMIEGQYRLFVYIYDEKNEYIATSNIPIYVMQ
jgi:hypothetical protein